MIPGFSKYELVREGDEWLVMGERGRLLKVSTGRWGHRFVGTVNDEGKKVRVQVARLVLLAHAGPPPYGRPYCLHRDGNPTHNDPSNLYWGTAKQNMADAARHGTQFRALTDAQAAEVRRRCAAGEFQWVLAAEFRVNRAVISRLVAGTSYQTRRGLR